MNAARLWTLVRLELHQRVRSVAWYVLLGVVDQPIGRHPVERKRMSVHGRRARTAVTRRSPSSSTTTPAPHTA